MLAHLFDSQSSYESLKTAPAAMISLCQADAAFRRVREDNQDLDIELLWLDEKDDHYAEAAHVRSALVARTADIGE